MAEISTFRPVFRISPRQVLVKNVSTHPYLKYKKESVSCRAPLIDFPKRRELGIHTSHSRARDSSQCNFSRNDNINDEKATSDDYASWSKVTENLTLSSTAVGIFLMAPQILKNWSFLSSGNISALSAISWTGFTSGFLGNMLLLSYFSNKGEISATWVQAVGASSTLLLLFQLRLAQVMPPVAFSSALAFLVLGLLLSFVRSTAGASSALNPIFRAWEDLNGVIGMAAFSQVFFTTFPSLLPLGTVPTLAPGVSFAALAVVLTALDWVGKLPGSFLRFWGGLSGWTATLLFMTMPVAQLKLCLADPSLLQSLSQTGLIFGILTNCLMIPRALFTMDIVWLTGCTWGTLVMGWGILTLMAIHGAASRLFVLFVSLLLFSYIALVVVKDSQVKNMATQLQ